MTPEEKQLLIKDLCARLPYGVKFQGEDSNVYTLDAANYFAFQVENMVFKPYLRPMSSMTQEENLKLDDMEFEMAHLKFTTYAHECMILDYLYSHHLDMRGLIPMGLALEAPEGMYKID